MEFLSEALQKYVEAHSSTESDLLKQIERETHLHVPVPQMLSGHLQGRILSMLSHMIRPTSILEIGSYTGYATICMAEGLSKQGRIVTIDNNEELSLRTQSYFDKSSFSEQIEMKIGDAVQIIPTLDYAWDLVFIDADKKNYSTYFDLVIDRVKENGCIVADNVLWSGKVCNPKQQDANTLAIKSFNEKVNADERVENLILPVRDGLMMMRKK